MTFSCPLPSDQPAGTEAAVPVSPLKAGSVETGLAETDLTETDLAPADLAAGPLAPELFERFSQLIGDRTGLNIRWADVATVGEKIFSRVTVTQQPSAESYYHFLAEPSPRRIFQQQHEWQQLIEQLTNGESFFFRDRGQFALLEQHIFPELLKRKVKDKQLRICSAGCATGEEPYSLAILIKQLMPDWQDWDISILGVDINPLSIEQAQSGRYRQWSLRGMSEGRKQQYFRQANQLFQLAPEIKKLVTFYPLNLVQDPFLLGPLDLIVCRNVFIYFSERAIARTLDKFYQALQPLGYLLTGHAELYGQDMSTFEIKSFPGSLIFQRPAQRPMVSVADGPMTSDTSPEMAPETALETEPQMVQQPGLQTRQKTGEPDSRLTHPLTTHQLSTHQSSTHRSQIPQPLRQAKLLLDDGKFQPALAQVQQALAKGSDRTAAYCLMAQIYLAGHQLDAAHQACEEAIAADEHAVALAQTQAGYQTLEPHYLMAKVAVAKGDLTAAKRTLRKILYLNANAIAAYLELSELYRQTGHAQKSDRLRQLAYDLFRQQCQPAAKSE